MVFSKMSEVNIHPNGEKSANLVTLLLKYPSGNDEDVPCYYPRYVLCLQSLQVIQEIVSLDAESISDDFFSD
jgi:hypothetical protein